MIRFGDFVDHVHKQYPDYCVVPVKHADLVFEERVKMNCFYCGKWNLNWKCPPRIPSVDFSIMFSEYEYLALVYCKYPFTSENYTVVRNESSIQLHHTLLKLEKFLWDHNNSTAISFIGGSCKLCKNGCGKEHCNNPYNARSPLEATGLNVIETAKMAGGLSICFPPEEFIIRIGMILW